MVRFCNLLKSNLLPSYSARSLIAESLSLEMVGFLRRCLSQQWEIRARLYEALAEIFKSTDSSQLRVDKHTILYYTFGTTK